MELIRQPKSFKNRIIDTFKSDENHSYLYNLFYDNLTKKFGLSHHETQYKLQTLPFDIYTFSMTNGYIHSVLDSDPIAMRAKLQGGLNLWDEIKRVNIIFYQERINSFLFNDRPPPQTQLNYNYSNNATSNYGLAPPSKPAHQKRGLVTDQIEIPYTPTTQRQAQNIPRAPRAPKTPNNTPRDVSSNPYSKLLDHVPTVGDIEDNEDYGMTMFISDSLRPQGYEYMNNMGPKYELLENQQDWKYKNGNQKYNRARTQRKVGTEDDSNEFNFSLINQSPLGNSSQYIAGDSIDDSSENYRTEYNTLKAIKTPNHTVRNAEDLIYELMGENYVDSNVALKNVNNMNSGESSTEFMRYKKIPFWQKLSREGVDKDINETLGFGMKESNNHIRGWDMDALRAKNGDNFSHWFGARNSDKH
jgi:hypothetical protein